MFTLQYRRPSAMTGSSTPGSITAASCTTCRPSVKLSRPRPPRTPSSWRGPVPTSPRGAALSCFPRTRDASWPRPETTRHAATTFRSLWPPSSPTTGTALSPTSSWAASARSARARPLRQPCAASCVHASCTPRRLLTPAVSLTWRLWLKILPCWVYADTATAIANLRCC
jgi:hypothetical protein